MADTIIEVEQGKLQGKVSLNYKGGKFYSFQGIPYAKPPVGELRFKAPLPPEPWQGVRNATTEDSQCYSRHFVFQDKIVGSEDCLFLNVYTPELPDGKKKLKKPVMFWIHGGGFYWGSGNAEFYGPEILMTRDVVLVTINYRLGILGFLKVEDPVLGTTGNAALKDVVMALNWVQKNIDKFGGDPNNVTIFGESAGSGITHCLILSTMAKGLFHRAIMQSGCALNPWVIGDESTDTLAKFLGYTGTNKEDIFHYLQNLPVEKILETQEKYQETFRCNEIRSFGITIEKSTAEMFFSEHPLKILKSGNYNKVPIVIGYTSREGIFIEMDVFASLKNFGNDFETKIPYYLNVPKGTELSLKIAKKIKDAYYGTATPTDENIDNLYQLETDLLFLRGIYKSIKLHLATLNCPIYFYRFSADTDINFLKKLLKSDKPGACHSDELSYLFKSVYGQEFKENSLEELMIQRMVNMWTNFARNGNPNILDDTFINDTWKPVEKECYYCLDIGNELKCITNPDWERMKIWDEITILVNNAKR